MNDEAPASAASRSSLCDLVVVAFEHRRAAELAELIRRQGGIPVSAPAMREVAGENRAELKNYLQELADGQVDVVVLLTGVGLKTLVRQVADHFSPADVAAALRRATLIARGPKPVAALRELGLTPQWTVPEPHTWEQLLQLVDDKVPVGGKTVAVQEYGLPNEQLLHGLTQRGARVRRVSIYRWEYPENLAPLRHGVRCVLDGQAAAAVFTSAQQVHNVWAFVENEFENEFDLWAQRLQHMVVASVGPVCSRALREHGIEPDLEASPPKMGVMVHLLAREARGCLDRKRSASEPSPQGNANSPSR
ncbi:MAG: hypothetical protein KatS3mg077_1754 [Candidatus Binatia bacterium]|nr:MAG: hypothetical protein KatS3mg077_1754 [Candidatus Binatia bacterium]